MKLETFMYIVNFALFVLNIVLACVSGPTLISTIVGWLLAGFWCFTSLIAAKMHEMKNELIMKQTKMIEDLTGIKGLADRWKLK